MPTKAQIAANRRNAQKSTGPRSDDGKAAVRQNALRHGLCATLATMSGERESDADELLEILREENQPVGANEEILVFKMAEHLFMQNRAGEMLTEEMDELAQSRRATNRASLFLRYYTAAERGFSRCLRELRKLQKERQMQEIGFVSKNADRPVEPAASDPSDPPADTSQPPETTPPAPGVPTPSLSAEHLPPLSRC